MCWDTQPHNKVNLGTVLFFFFSFGGPQSLDRSSISTVAQHRLTRGEAAFAPPLARAFDCPSQYPRSPHRRAHGDARAQYHHHRSHPNFYRSQSRCSRPCSFLVFLLASIFSPRTPRPFVAYARTWTGMATLRVWKRWHWLLSFSGVGGGGVVCGHLPRSMEKYEDVPHVCEVLRFSPSKRSLAHVAGS